MTRRIFIITIVISFFSGGFCLKALSLEKQNKGVESAGGIVKKKRVGSCEPLLMQTYFEEAEEELSTELVEFETGRGVTLKYVLVRPENPLAIAILLPGGPGT